VRSNGLVLQWLRSIAIALVVALVAAPSGAAGPKERADLARARALDKEAAKAYGEGRYRDAIRYFEEAYRLGGPAFELWNVAKCYLRLDEPEQAAEMLEKYLATPNLPKEDRREASQQLAQLKKRPSTLTVSSTPSGAEVTVDGKRLEGRTPLSITIPPGQHTVAVRSESGAYTTKVEARYGRAVVVDAALSSPGAEQSRPPPPPNPYDEPDGDLPITLRGAFGVVLPRHGSIGGDPGFGLMALGTYRLTEIGKMSIAAGALLAVSGDSWGNRTGEPNTAPNCGPLTDAQSATALSLFAIFAASYSIASRWRIGGMGGLGLAGYFVDNVGGDLFIPSCRPSPGVRPALLLGTEIAYAATSYLRLSAFPLTWQIQPAFDGTRATPRDASGVWMRFGIGIGAGVDL
jgi:hypothetical protein